MGNMISRKSVDYFELLSEGMGISLEAAKRLKAAFADGIINEEELKLINEMEQKGDDLRHNVLKLVNVAFITPIDRIDIVTIMNEIENVTDSIDKIAHSIYMMRLTKTNDFLRNFVDLTVSACEKLNELMIALKKFKKNSEDISRLIVEVNKIEGQGNEVYSKSIIHLFETERNAIEVIKQKELYDLLENTLNQCEEVANTVDNIMIAKT
jgi:uncharacterized protein Yka (UPF0111/DUF47 family)